MQVKVSIDAQDFRAPQIPYNRRFGIKQVLLCLSGCLCGIALTQAALVAKSLLADSHDWSWNTASINSVDPLLRNDTTTATGVSACGQTWRDAQFLGCTYDLMASRWFPPECFSQHDLDAMLSDLQTVQGFPQLPWFLDPEHTEPATWSHALGGTFDHIYTSYNYHILHCLYSWRRLHSAIVEHRHIDSGINDYDHTVHCSRMIMSWHESDFGYGEGNHSTAAHALIPLCSIAKL